MEKNESSEEEKKSKPFLANFNCNVWEVQEFKANWKKLILTHNTPSVYYNCLACFASIYTKLILRVHFIFWNDLLESSDE